MSTAKQLATIRMLEAYGATRQAYYDDATAENLAAYHACKTAIEVMLRPYYMGASDDPADD